MFFCRELAHSAVVYTQTFKLIDNYLLISVLILVVISDVYRIKSEKIYVFRLFLFLFVSKKFFEMFNAKI
jgi:hypothetical protein